MTNGPPKWLGWVCHQRPDRSFTVCGRQCWVCARCQGFYYLFPVGLLVPLLYPPLQQLSASFIFALTILALIPMAIDGGTQYLGMRESNNPLRFITGAVAGFFLGFAVTTIIFIPALG